MISAKSPSGALPNGDRQTKRALTVVMFFFTLAETGSPEKLPLITISAE